MTISRITRMRRFTAGDSLKFLFRKIFAAKSLFQLFKRKLKAGLCRYGKENRFNCRVSVRLIAGVRFLRVLKFFYECRIGFKLFDKRLCFFYRHFVPAPFNFIFSIIKRIKSRIINYR